MEILNMNMENEEMFKVFIENMPEPFLILNEKGVICGANSKAISLFFCNDTGELVGRNAAEFITQKERLCAKEHFRDVLESGSDKYFELMIQKDDNTLFNGEISASKISDSDDVLIIIRDISERKNAEVVLKEKEERCRAMMETNTDSVKERLAVTVQSISEGVITVGVDGKITLVNIVAEKLTGWKQNEALGQPLDDVLYIVCKREHARGKDLINRVIESRNVIDIFSHSLLISKDGTERTVTLSYSPIKDYNNAIVGVVLIIHDITEKQKLENELFRARKLESIGVLAGGIAHDFNNILTGITANMFMAKIGIDKNSETYASINNAEKAAFRASRLTNQLLTFAKSGTPRKESQSIREVVEESVGFSLSGSNVDCRLELPDNLWNLEIDRGQIDQVINNLIINSDQAMPDGGTIFVRGDNVAIDENVLEGTNAYLPLDPGKYVRISIKDDGIGIRPDDIEKIFDPYFTTKPNGNGLGLTISYSILKKHGGLIFVKSHLGEGATFHIYLPALDENRPKEIANRDCPVRGSGKILVMDDEKVVRIAASQVLRTIGYEVGFAKDGAEAIEMYKDALDSESPFDALIIDLTIPGGMGGKEAIKQLIKIHPGVKAIVSSGYSNDMVMANYRQYGFSGVVAKPYMVEELSEVLHMVIFGNDSENEENTSPKE